MNKKDIEMLEVAIIYYREDALETAIQNGYRGGDYRDAFNIPMGIIDQALESYLALLKGENETHGIILKKPIRDFVERSSKGERGW